MTSGERARPRWRAWLGRRRVTLSLAALLVAWFALEIWVAATHGTAAFLWAFTASSAGDPTPGLVLAPLSHLSVAHLANNVVALLLFGGFVEPHLREGEYLLGVTVAGAGTTLSEIAYWSAIGQPVRVMGASGATFALATFFSWHYFRDHVDAPRRRPGNHAAFLVAAVGFLQPVGTVALGAVGLLPAVLASGGHLLGMALGAVYGAARSCALE